MVKDADVRSCPAPSTAARRLIFILVIPALMFLENRSAAAPAPAREKPNFSGVWEVDLQKSKIVPQFKVESGSFAVVHRGNNFHFSRVFVEDGKNDTFAYDLTTDGKEVVTEEPGQTAHSRLYWDGDVLVYDVRIIRKNGREATDVVRYSLHDGGRTFIAEERSRGPVVNYDNFWVARKRD